MNDEQHEKRISEIRAMTDALSITPQSRAAHEISNAPHEISPMFAAMPTKNAPATPGTTTTELFANDTNSVGESLRPNVLLPIRNGYDRLSTLATQLQKNQTLLTRGMRCAQSSFANSYHTATKQALGLIGVAYEVPNLRETVQLQLAHVRQYGVCVDEIVMQTASELKSTHEYVGSLARDMLKLAAIKERLLPNVTTDHSAMYLNDVQLAVTNKKLLETFLASHDKKVHGLMQRADVIVADRAIQRKSEYLRHAYAVELLLIGSLTSAKQIAVDAGCYGAMLDRLASAYFNLGCNAAQLKTILGGLETMQQFTDTMQTSVANGLQRLDKALLQTRTTIGPGLETAVYQMRS